jgi:hypothetical protein
MYYQPKIFHASSKAEKTPILLLSNRTLDFGAGFYASPDKSLAESFCQKFRRQNRSAVCNVYKVDIENLINTCNICYFESPDRQWVEFVVTNRTGSFLSEYSDYDIIIGPCGDDVIYSSLNLLETGIIDIDETVSRCKNHMYTDQIAFKTKKALAYLHHLHCYSI